MQTVTVTAQERSSFGKSSNNTLRKEGRIPAVIYSKDSVKHCSVTEADLKHLVYTPDFKLAEVSVGGASAKCTLQDIQFHPVTDNIVHVDFLELVPGHALKVSVPVKFKGVSPGDGIEVMTAEATPIASVEIPRALKTAGEEETGAEVAVEGAGEAAAEEA